MLASITSENAGEFLVLSHEIGAAAIFEHASRIAISDFHGFTTSPGYSELVSKHSEVYKLAVRNYLEIRRAAASGRILTLQELHKLLQARGLDTIGLRPTLLERLRDAYTSYIDSQ